MYEIDLELLEYHKVIREWGNRKEIAELNLRQRLGSYNPSDAENDHAIVRKANVEIPKAIAEWERVAGEQYRGFAYRGM